MRRLIAGALCLLAIAPSPADVTVFRVVNKKNNEFAEINNRQWRIDDDGVSTLDESNFKTTAKPCKVQFVIQGVNPAPAPGTTGPVAGMPGIKGVYTPEHGNGHWSIEGINGNIGLSDHITDGVISTHAATPNQNVRPNKFKCETPAAPNVTRRRSKRRVSVHRRAG